MCSCVGIADGILCSLVSGGIYLATLPPRGCLEWVIRHEKRISTDYELCTVSTSKGRIALSGIFFSHRELKLRNYTPEDEELKERQVPKAKPASGDTSSIVFNS